MCLNKISILPFFWGGGMLIHNFLISSIQTSLFSTEINASAESNNRVLLIIAGYRPDNGPSLATGFELEIAVQQPP